MLVSPVSVCDILGDLYVDVFLFLVFNGQAPLTQRGDSPDQSRDEASDLETSHLRLVM